VALLGTVGVVRRQLPMEVGGLIAASALLWLASLGGTITRVEGVLLILVYAAWLTRLARTQANSTHVPRRALPRGRAPLFIAVIVACFIAMALIADPLLGAATRLVAHLPMSASLFGVLVLGICAALPELMTALVSIGKGQREISAGILIGSNITNPLLAAGLGASISGYTVPMVLVVYDLPVKILTGALLYALLWRRSTLSRIEALLLIGLYIGYVAVRGALFPADF
jgi:cation:H+ antiporter